MAAHAKLSPSSANRWMVCTAAPQACAAVRDESSEAADFGTFCHEIAARALVNGKDATSWLGRSSDCGRFEIDAETADHISFVIEALKPHGEELELMGRGAGSPT